MMWIAWFLILGFWLIVLLRVERGRKKAHWRLGPDAPLLPLPRLTVVIPARNEAEHIGACVAAVKASDHPDLDVVVFDDASTDGTGAIATAAGARVILGEGGPPPGWKGKPWALQRAMEALGPQEWTLFLDADVRVHPAALSRAHSYAVQEQLDLLSGLGRLVMGSFWEKVIQPSVGGLILAGNDLDKANSQPERAIANGQFILVRTETWRRLGGHGAVKDDILDDIGLARVFTRGGAKVRCLFMRELFSCRMYRSLGELWYGWTKNLYAGIHYRLSTALVLVGVVAFYFLSPYVLFAWALATGASPWIAAWGGLLLFMHLVRARLDLVFDQQLPYGLLQPLGALMLIGLVLDSVRRSRAGSIRWKGRSYSAG